MSYFKTLIMLGALSLLACSQTIHAASISLIPEHPAILPGFTAYGIWWDGEGVTDWAGALLVVELTQGTFYQDALGVDGAPNPALLTFFPTLEYDTYFGIIGDGSAGFCGGAAEGYSPCTMTPTYIELPWFNNDTNNTGLVKIGT